MAGVIRGEAQRFLFAGGTAALFNWLMRIMLSLVMPLGPATLIAYLMGMALGFVLYRAFVFAGTQGHLVAQVAAFVLVNVGSAVLVVGVTLGLTAGLAHGLPWHGVCEALAHGAAIALGAVTNFLGHRAITFARRGELPVLQSR